MKISSVTVRYGELRSTGYPSYSNKRYEVELAAQLDPGDMPQDVRNRLTDLAKKQVAQMFGDPLPATDEMGIPF